MKQNHKIGIIGAMQVEVEGLIARLSDPKEETVSGIRFVCGTLAGKEVVVAHCGIGKVFAALCAQTMILRYGTDCILNTGVAGTLSPELGILDLAIATAVVQHDMDTSAIGDPVGLISGINRITLPASDEMGEKIATAAGAMGIVCRQGVIASGDVFVNDGSRKAWIREQFDAIACDMEAGAIGQVCLVNGIPCSVLRTISDNASGEAEMEYPKMVAIAAERSQQLLLSVLPTL